jgi:ABC-2 type transport system permease protein
MNHSSPSASGGGRARITAALRDLRVRALPIAWKDFRHTYRNIPALAMMLAAPFVLATALGAAFGGSSDFSVRPVNVAIVNLDVAAPAAAGGAAAGGGAAAPPAGQVVAAQRAGAAIEQALQSPALKDLVLVHVLANAEAAKAAVDKGDYGVAVVIPAGLTDSLSSATPVPTKVLVYSDSTLTIGPGVVSSIVSSVVRSLTAARASAVAAVQLSMAAGVRDPAALGSVATSAAQLVAQSLQAGSPVDVAVRTPSASSSSRNQPNVAGQVLIGMMIFFMFFGASQPARSILDEHRNGTLPRLFTTPTRRSTILAGKYLAVFLVVLLQSIILLAAGRLVYGSHWGLFGPVAVLTVCGALVAASLALLMMSFAKTPAQAGAFSSAIFVFLGLVGGNFVGTVNFGGPLATLRLITPNGWLIKGWSNVLFGGSWGSIGLPVLVVLAFSAVFFAVATILFRRRYA